MTNGHVEFGYFTMDEQTIHKFRIGNYTTLCGSVGWSDVAPGRHVDLESPMEVVLESTHSYSRCASCFIEDRDFEDMLEETGAEPYTEGYLRYAYRLGLLASIRKGYCPADDVDVSDSWYYGMPDLIGHLMSAMSHLSNFQDSSDDQAANDLINQSKVILQREMERRWEAHQRRASQS